MIVRLATPGNSLGAQRRDGATKRERRAQRRLPFLRGLALLAAALCIGQLPAGAASPAEMQDVVHAWRRMYYGVLDGRPGLMFAETIERAKPALGDVDGDGDLDLIVGTAQGRLMYFENQGTAKAPRWRLVNEALTALPMGQGPPGDDPQTIINVGANAAPALMDIDGDGDLDLFVGSASGKLAFYRNVGNTYLPIFRLESADVLGGGFGQNLVPKLADVNGDGLPDLALGNEAGEVWLLVNQGTRQEPRWCPAAEPVAPCLIPRAKLVQLAGVDNAVPDWVDWSGDGLPDLMVGKSDGTLDYYLNIGMRTKPVWELKEPRFNIMSAGAFAAPLFADVDGDGVPDLFLAGDRELIALYTGKPKDPKDRRAGVELWIQDENALQVLSLTAFDARAHVAAGNLFGNGRQDLVVGTASGQIYVYENVGGKEVPAFRAAGGPVLPTPQRGLTAPTLLDVDGDGLLDIVVGDRNGQLEWIRNAGTPKAPEWKPGGLYFAGIGVGALSVPLAADVDGDGLPDLLVGNSRGLVIYYRNTGTAQAPQFALASTRFGGISVSAAASPGLFPWNPRQPPDLVVGGQDGALLASVRDSALPAGERGAYQPMGAPWVNLRAKGYSAPLFADLMGIGRPQLLIGTDSGHVLLWRYEGSLPRKEVARERPHGLNLLVDQTPVSPESEAARAAAAAAVAAGAADASGTVIAGRAPSQALAPLSMDPVFQEEPSELNGLPVGRHSKPAFFDANGDGKPDLVVGNAEGKLLLFENLGPPQNPQWRLATSEFAGFKQGRNAAPAFADFDGDGDLDLVVGTDEGQVFYFENTGTARAPVFTYREGALRNMRGGKNVVPLPVDLEPHGPQLLLGSLRGGLQYFRRKTGPVLDYELADRRFLGLDLGVNTSPSSADLTQSRRPELFVGTDKGPVAVMERSGTDPLRTSGWRPNTSYLAGLRMPAGSHAALVDLDGDGDLDLVVGSDRGPLLFFRNNAIVRDLAPPSPAPERR